MPRNSKNPKRRTYRRRSYNRRLSDKRINTTVERRIKEIAQREDQKQIQYFVKPELIAKSGYTWDGIANDPPIGQRLEINDSAAPFSVCLSEIGNTLATQMSINETPGPTRSVSNTMLIKNIQAHLRFQNWGVETQYITVLLVATPNSTDGGGTINEPVLDYYVKNSIKYKGIFSPLQRTTEVTDETGAQTTYIVDKTNTILARKTFALPPARSLSGGNNNSTGYNTKQISISKNYKVGRRVKWQYPNAGTPAAGQALPDSNIFLWIQGSGQAVDGQNSTLVWGIAGVRYRLLDATGRGINTGQSTVGSVP